MEEAYLFLSQLSEKLEELHDLLTVFVKSEKAVLQPTPELPFLARKYVLSSKLNTRQIVSMDVALQQLYALEIEISYTLNKNKKLLNELERDYNALRQSNFRLKEYFIERMNAATSATQVARNRIFQLKRTTDSTKVPEILESLDRLVTQILHFTDFVFHLSSVLKKFSEGRYYDVEHTYGRAMSKPEAKMTKKTGLLLGSPKRGITDLVAVFDVPPITEDILKKTPTRALRDFFSRLGASGATRLVLFKTALKPINFDSPLPLRVTFGGRTAFMEYKFPRGISIKIGEIL